MQVDPHSGVRSTAAINGHPLHPMLVPFPIAFLVGALVTDIVYASSSNEFWAQASFWLLLAGIVMGVLAALAGLTDFLTIQRVRDLKIAWFHFLGNAVALLIAIWNVSLRWGDPTVVGLPQELVLSLLTVVIFLGTGWIGGELVFRHKIGVIEASSEPAPVPEGRVDERLHRPQH